MTRFNALCDALSKWAGYLSATMFAIAPFVIGHMLFMRFVLNRSTIWQTEFASYMVVAATLLGCPYVLHRKGHVAVSLVRDHLSAQRGKYFDAAISLIWLAVFAILNVYAIELAWEAYDRGWQSDTVWAVRLWIPYLAMPVSFSLICLQAFSDTLAILFGDGVLDPREEFKKSEGLK